MKYTNEVHYWSILMKYANDILMNILMKFTKYTNDMLMKYANEVC
jgi:hypothetical protein